MYLGSYYSGWASLVAQWKRICLPIQEMWVQPLGQEDPLEKEMATYSSILAWEIPQTEEPGRLQPMGSQRVRHNLETTTLWLLRIIPVANYTNPTEVI